jgi:hypothetical protein
VPEFEARRTSGLPPFPSAARRSDAPSRDNDVPLEIPQREGLPPGYRMRHDAHYVDQLTARGGPQPHLRAVLVRDIDHPRSPDLQDLEPLVRSIARHGLLEPLLVRARNGRFELLAGGRRLRAAALAGLTEVPCLVHTCDDERARAVKEAAAVRRGADPGATRRGGELSASALAELRRSFGTIGSCLHLMREREGPLRDRVALDLIRTETHRAHRLVQAIHLLTQDPPLATVEVPIAPLVEQALDGFEPERRLSATAIRVELSDGVPRAWGDPEWLMTGLTGAIGGVLAIVQAAKAPAVEIRVARASDAAVVRMEIAQRVVSVPEWAVPRFFDATWTDRPGGYQAATELAAARQVFQRHSGACDLLAAERGGCRLVLTLPAAIR